MHFRAKHVKMLLFDLPSPRKPYRSLPRGYYVPESYRIRGSLKNPDGVILTSIGQMKLSYPIPTEIEGEEKPPEGKVSVLLCRINAFSRAISRQLLAEGMNSLPQFCRNIAPRPPFPTMPVSVCLH